MALNMFTASIPVFQRALHNLDGILLKAETHAQESGIDPLVLTSARLYPDMLPLTSQVFIAADMAKGGAARLAGRDAPAYPDVETTFVALSARVRKTIEFLDGFQEDEFVGSDTRHIVLKLRTRTLEFQGQEYLQNFVIPNLYFHIATCYGILRHNGVRLGKADFLGS
jgi:hypothetical protein